MWYVYMYIHTSWNVETGSWFTVSYCEAEPFWINTNFVFCTISDFWGILNISTVYNAQYIDKDTLYIIKWLFNEWFKVNACATRYSTHQRVMQMIFVHFTCWVRCVLCSCSLIHLKQKTQRIVVVSLVAHRYVVWCSCAYTHIQTTCKLIQVC